MNYISYENFLSCGLDPQILGTQMFALGQDSPHNQSLSQYISFLKNLPLVCPLPDHNPINLSFCAMKEGALTGFINSTTLYGTTDVDFFCVAPGHRRQGVGENLWNLFELSLLEKWPGSRILLEVGVENDPACSFYKKKGFTTIGQRKGYYRGGGHAFVMEKKLG